MYTHRYAKFILKLQKKKEKKTNELVWIWNTDKKKKQEKISDFIGL